MNDYFTCNFLNRLKSSYVLIGLKDASKAFSGKYLTAIAITAFM